jgi:catechol 2,3-dioxygenase-like lactoylglutathione lyase family enzyme
MLTTTNAYSSLAAHDMTQARTFYRDTLGLAISEEDGLMWLHLAGGRDTLVYPAPDATPPSYTILNFEVDDIGAAVDALTARGVRFQRFDDLTQDAKGIFHGEGPSIAWFTDPTGNILSVLQERDSGEEVRTVATLRSTSLLLGTTQPQRLRAFYEGVFALTAVEGWLQLGSVRLLIDCRDDVAERATEPGRVLLTVDTDDARALVTRLEHESVRWVSELEERDDGLFCTFEDPDGNMVQIVQLNDAYFARITR